MKLTKSSPDTRAMNFKPSRSNETKKRVNELVLNRIKNHSEEVVKYVCCTTTQCWKACILKVRIKDGVITACEPDDTINQGIARDDEYLSEKTIKKGMI